MTQPVDRKVSVSQPPANAAVLVSETLAFLVAWRRILSGTGPWPSAEVLKLREQSRTLQGRARELGVGGLAHHLQTCDDCLAFEVVDRAELSRRLRNVSELTSQLRQETDPIRASRPPAAASARPAPRATEAVRTESVAAPAPPAAEVTLSAPPVPITAVASTPVGSDSSAVSPAASSPEAREKPLTPQPVAATPADVKTSSPPAAGTSPPAAGTEPGRAPSIAPRSGSFGPMLADPKRELTKSDAPRFQIPRPDGSISSLRPRAPSAAPGSAPRPRPAPEAETPKAPETTPKAPETTLTAPRAETAAPSSPASVSPPPLLTAAASPAGMSPAELPSQPAPARTPVSTPPPEAVVAPLPVSALGSDPAGPTALPTIPVEPAPAIPPALDDASARSKLDTLVGVNEAEAPETETASPKPQPVYVPPTAPPQPRRDVRPPELSVLAMGGADTAATTIMRDVEPRPDWAGPPGPPPAPFPLGAPPLESVPPPSSELDELPWQTPWSRPASRWWLVPLVAGAAAIIVVFWKDIRSYASLLGPAPQLPGASDPQNPIALEPQPSIADLGERLRVLVERVHAYGGNESPELGDLINREAEEVGRALGQPCAGPVACAAADRARALLDPRAAPLAKEEAEGGRALGAWLVGLALPGIGVRDVPIVQERVEFHTRYTTGREVLQVLLFQCAAYRQTIADSLLQHELPLDLMALPMAESGCSPDAEARVGARGLWQLTPQAAAAYHLEVVPEVLDERVSTTKSTEVALRLLSDVHRKLGSWELALASYHVGPFELVAHLLRAEPETDFWRLATAGKIDGETGAYVGRVQAFAVILANLQHFGFTAPEQVDAERVAELEVPAGTRLGVVARAAGSSLTQLRELNPELLADTLPDAPGKTFRLLVPSESVRRARARLPGLIAADDASDRCVPYSFDWGRQRFTKAMASRCEYLSADAR